MSQQFTTEEVAQHNKPDDCWVTLHGKVYDVTAFLKEHPGGKAVLLRAAGKVRNLALSLSGGITLTCSH